MAQLDTLTNRVGKGWEPILLKLHDDLLLKFPDYLVLQVKEKFGGLRVYLGSYPNIEVLRACQDLIEDASAESLTTCEDCGAEGLPGQAPGSSWIRTLCSTCRRGGFTLVGGEQLVRVHSAWDCAPESCPIHRPSRHHMVMWPQHYRDDRKIMERICEHGVGHPDPDDVRIRKGVDEGVHSCCGCC